jgi:hypothetical protein
MNFKTALKTVTSSRSMRGGAFAMLVACAAASPAGAAPIRVQARQDNSVESSFALIFGGQGGVASALISRTDFELEIDGPAGTARFLNYDQDIDALTLPGPTGPLSTGAIRVQIVPGSSTGTYNRATGEFETNELYNIEFDGNLIALGLVSPVILPSQSVGVVDLANTTVGRVTMNWAGNATFPFDFSYICTLFATFSATPASYIETALVPLVAGTTMPATLRTTLMSYLDSAITALNAGNVRGGVRSLSTFILKVRSSVPGSISQVDALVLVSVAEQAIAFAQNPRLMAIE